MRRLAFACFMCIATPAVARPVVVELFTSEACSSCPPAEALLADLKKSDPDVLPLSFHVTYWNGPAWTDKYSLAAATGRQSWYASVQNSQEVYTPEAVVDGLTGMVGSNRGDVTSAIASAKALPAGIVQVSVSGDAMVTIRIGGGDSAPANIWLFGFDASHTTQIGGGENGGATLTEVNVVRSVNPLGSWNGAAESFTLPKPAGEHMAVLLQKDNGSILGAAAD